MEGQSRDDVAQAAGVHDAIGRLEQYRKRRLVHELGAHQKGWERIVLDGQLLAPEDHERDIGGSSRVLGEVPHELERDRDAALHVARTEPMNRAIVDPARDVVLRRDGVVVPGEDDERHRRPPPRGEQEDLVARIRARVRRWDEREQVLADRLLVTALRGDVHELERACREALGERGHRASLQRP